MTVYVVLYIIFAIIGYSAYRSYADFEVKRKRVVWIAFSLIFVLLAFRHQSMGIDLGYNVNGPVSYLQAFENLTDLSWRTAFSGKYSYFETGYEVFCKVVGTIWKNRQFFLAVCAAVSLFPIAWFLSKNSKSPLLSCVIYLSLTSFEILFSGLRQGISIGIAVIALYYVQQKNIVKFLVTIAIACLFHSSAWIFLVAYPAYYLKIQKKLRFASLGIILAVYIFRYQLFYLFARLFKQNPVPDNNGALNFLIFLVALYFVCTVFYNEDDAEHNGLMNLLLICCLTQVFGNIFSTALRVGYYFMFPIALLIPCVVENMDRRTKLIAKFTIIVFFVTYGLWSIYHSSWSMRFPYYWCWESV